MTLLAQYLKALCGALVAAGGTAATAASDGHITLTEGVTIAVAFFAALGGIAAVRNVMTTGQLQAQPNLRSAQNAVPSNVSIVWPPLIPTDDTAEADAHHAAYLTELDARMELEAKHPRDSHGRFKKGTP